LRWYWICFAISCLSALISLGYSMAALRGRGRSDVYRQYAGSRSVAVAGAVVAAAFVRSRDLMLVLAFATALMQGLDALVGLDTGERAKVLGPAAVSVLTLVAAVLLLGH
jgi:hypothetical protein